MDLLTRREFIGGAVKLAATSALATGVATQILPALAPASLSVTGAGPILLRDRKSDQKVPVTLGMLAGEPPVVVTGEWNFFPTAVYKVKRSVLEAAAVTRGYNTGQHALPHPTEPDCVILAYDAKCTHLGCTVGWEGAIGASNDTADYDDDGSRDGAILCPCHQGRFDPCDLGKNQPGTPPTTPLDVVRFAVVDWTDETGTHPGALVAFEKIGQDAYCAADREGPGAPFQLADPAVHAAQVQGR